MIRGLLLSSLCVAALATPAAADSGNLLGVFKNWSAYSTGSGDSLTCYALSKPRASRPMAAKRSDVFLMVADWPGRKIKAEPEVVPGYEFKANGPVVLEIGSDKFDFFSRNEAKSGTAWLRNLADTDRLQGALNSGVSAVVLATSAKGTKTVDTYSLAGFGEAVAKIHDFCKM
jgi:hypothetical protein